MTLLRDAMLLRETMAEEEEGEDSSTNRNDDDDTEFTAAPAAGGGLERNSDNGKAETVLCKTHATRSRRRRRAQTRGWGASSMQSRARRASKDNGDGFSGLATRARVMQAMLVPRMGRETAGAHATRYGNAGGATTLSELPECSGCGEAALAGRDEDNIAHEDGGADEEIKRKGAPKLSSRSATGWRPLRTGTTMATTTARCMSRCRRRCRCHAVAWRAVQRSSREAESGSFVFSRQLNEKETIKAHSFFLSFFSLVKYFSLRTLASGGPKRGPFKKYIHAQRRRKSTERKALG